MNPNADVMGRNAATFMCVNAAKGLHEVIPGGILRASAAHVVS